MRAKEIDEKNKLVTMNYADSHIDGVETMVFIDEIIESSKALEYIHGEFYGFLNRVLYASVHNLPDVALKDLSILKELIELHSLDNKYLLDYYRAYALYKNECLSEHSSGVEYLEKALELAQKIEDYEAIHRIKTSIGTINYILGNYEVAQAYMKAALDNLGHEEDVFQKMIVMFNYASSLIETNDYEMAEKHLNEVLLLSRENKQHQMEISAVSTYALLLRKLGRIDDAIIMMDQVETEFHDYSNHYELHFLLEKVELLIHKKLYEEAEELLEKHLKNLVTIKNLSGQSDLYKTLSEVKAGLNKHEEAYTYLQKHLEVYSKLNEKQTEQKLNEVMHKEFNKSIKQLEMIAEIGRELSVSDDIKVLVADIEHKLKDLLSIDAIGIGIINNDEINFGYFMAESMEMPVKVIHKNDPYSLATWCIRNQVSVFISDAESELPQYIDKRVHTKTREGDKELVKINSILYAPLIVKGETVGVFTIQSGKKNAYFDEHKNIFNIITSYVAIAIRNIQQAQALEMLTKTDSLTGVFNRRGFNEYFDVQLLENPNVHDVTLMILDLDYFKRVNDLFGHVKGDVVLRKVAELIDGHIEKDHCFARLGGEEFGLLLYNTSIEEAYNAALDIKNSVKTMEVEGLEDFELTISIGICRDLKDHALKLDDLYHSADKALYLAKDNGRDTVESCHEFR